jgi:hypothetical protein
MPSTTPNTRAATTWTNNDLYSGDDFLGCIVAAFMTDFLGSRLDQARINHRRS